jgi:flagellar basal body-associated protein FliL
MKSRSRIIILHISIALILVLSVGLTSMLLVNKYQAIQEKKQEYTDKIRYYQSIIDIECNWIKGNQVSNGALLF